jgi:hypothetical protein
MHRTIKPRPHHLRYAARIVAVRLAEAQHPKSSAIHKLPADYPIFRVASGTL